MPICYCAKPPKLLFTNFGLRSPDDFQHDEFGIPTFADGIQHAVQSSMWTYPSDPEKKEKHTLYGTHIEEVMAWMETIQDRHGFDAQTGLLEQWLLPSGEALPDEPEEDGNQLDGYSLHNPDFWALMVRQIYLIRGYAPLTEQEQNYIRNWIVARQFPKQKYADPHPYSHLISGTGGYFTHGRVSETLTPNWLFPFGFAGKFRFNAWTYKAESTNFAGLSGENFVVDNMTAGYLPTQDVFGANGASHYHGVEDTWNYYRYRISLIALPWRSADANFTSPIETFPDAPKSRTLRQQLGLWGDEKNGAFAFKIRTQDYNNTGTDVVLDGEVSGFRLGLWWRHSRQFPASNQLTFDEIQTDTTWFHEITAGNNIVELPDEILDQLPPDPDDFPFLVIAPPNEPIAQENRHIIVQIPWNDADDFTPEVTGYAHNYLVENPDKPIGTVFFGGKEVADWFRICVDDYLLHETFGNVGGGIIGSLVFG